MVENYPRVVGTLAMTLDGVTSNGSVTNRAVMAIPPLRSLSLRGAPPRPHLAPPVLADNDHYPADDVIALRDEFRAFCLEMRKSMRRGERIAFALAVIGVVIAVVLYRWPYDGGDGSSPITVVINFVVTTI